MVPDDIFPYGAIVAPQKVAGLFLILPPSP